MLNHTTSHHVTRQHYKSSRHVTRQHYKSSHHKTALQVITSRHKTALQVVSSRHKTALQVVTRQHNTRHVTRQHYKSSRHKTALQVTSCHKTALQVVTSCHKTALQVVTSQDSTPHSQCSTNNIMNSFTTHQDMRRHITEPVDKVTSLLTLLFFPTFNLQSHTYQLQINLHRNLEYDSFVCKHINSCHLSFLFKTIRRYQKDKGTKI
jgi:hypothetical protein